MSGYALHVDDNADPAAAIITGELDRFNAEDLAAALDAVPGRRPMILDLSQLRFIDSAGFAAVIRMLEQRAIVLVVAPVSFLRKAATVMGLPMHDHIQAARDFLGRGPHPS